MAPGYGLAPAKYKLGVESQLEQQAREDKYILQSVENALRLVEALSGVDETGISVLSSQLKLGKSTVFRLLATLKSKGYVKQNPQNEKYSLGLKFAHLGSAVIAKLNLIDVAHPFLQQLSRQYDETTHLVILDGDEGVFVDRVSSSVNTLQMQSSVGSRMPAYCTATGKLLLAFNHSDDLDQYLGRVQFVRFTHNTITSREALRAELMQIRADGYSEDREEKEVGLFCYAAPVRDNTGQIVAACSISGPGFRIKEKRPELIDAIRQTAETISAAIRWSHD